jgi:hypothetical protein
MRAIILVLALAGSLVAAPAPRPKPPKPVPVLPVVGTWSMIWKQGRYVVTFGPDGSYQCSSGHAGTWCYDRDTCVMHVEEIGVTQGEVIHWSVTLHTWRTGTLMDDSEWSIEEVQP